MGQHEYERRAYKEKRNLVGPAVTVVAAVIKSRAQSSKTLGNIFQE